MPTTFAAVSGEAAKNILSIALTPATKSIHLTKWLSIRRRRWIACFSPYPTRLRRAIVARLAQGDITIATLAAPFAISLVAVSKHIRVLEQAGLITRTKLGREFHLKLVPEKLQSGADWIDQFEQFWTQHLDHVKARAEQKALERARLKSKNP